MPALKYFDPATQTWRVLPASAHGHDDAYYPRGEADEVFLRTDGGEVTGPVTITASGSLTVADGSTATIGGSLVVPHGAAAGSVLTSDGEGVASWQPLSPSSGAGADPVLVDWFTTPPTGGSVVPPGWDLLSGDGAWAVAPPDGGCYRSVGPSSLRWGARGQTLVYSAVHLYRVSVRARLVGEGLRGSVSVAFACHTADGGFLGYTRPVNGVPLTSRWSSLSGYVADSAAVSEAPLGQCSPYWSPAAAPPGTARWAPVLVLDDTGVVEVDMVEVRRGEPNLVSLGGVATTRLDADVVRAGQVEVTGGIRVPHGAEGRVLTSDASGAARWDEVDWSGGDDRFLPRTGGTVAGEVVAAGGLVVPQGAGEGMVLTSDGEGAARWADGSGHDHPDLLSRSGGAVPGEVVFLGGLRVEPSPGRGFVLTSTDGGAAVWRDGSGHEHGNLLDRVAGGEVRGGLLVSGPLAVAPWGDYREGMVLTGGPGGAVRWADPAGLRVSVMPPPQPRLGDAWLPLPLHLPTFGECSPPQGEGPVSVVSQEWADQDGLSRLVLVAPTAGALVVDCQFDVTHSGGGAVRVRLVSVSDAGTAPGVEGAPVLLSAPVPLEMSLRPVVTVPVGAGGQVEVVLQSRRDPTVAASIGTPVWSVGFTPGALSMGG